MKHPRIIIEIQGGVATVAHKDQGVALVIRDYDNVPEDPDPGCECETQTWDAETTVMVARPDQFGLRVEEPKI